jgi:hypothetical protein
MIQIVLTRMRIDTLVRELEMVKGLTLMGMGMGMRMGMGMGMMMGVMVGMGMML